jgi:hypothetical protein
MSKVCKSCGNENGNFSQCSNGSTTWYQCVDFKACDDRTNDKRNKEREERNKRNIGKTRDGVDIYEKDLIEIGVLYRDATTYYYNKESDTMFKQFFGGGEISKRLSPITSYERNFINKKLAAISED